MKITSKLPRLTLEDVKEDSNFLPDRYMTNGEFCGAFLALNCEDTLKSLPEGIFFDRFEESPQNIIKLFLSRIPLSKATPMIKTSILVERLIGRNKFGLVRLFHNEERTVFTWIDEKYVTAFRSLSFDYYRWDKGIALVLADKFVGVISEMKDISKEITDSLALLYQKNNPKESGHEELINNSLTNELTVSH